MPSTEPYILEPEDQSAGRPATFIFMHGFGDDAEGLPLGLAQQFQMYHKMPYLRWVLPNAGYNHEAANTAWYVPKALPNAIKPRVPGEDAGDDEADDDEGILQSVDRVDAMVKEEMDRGVSGDRIIVGGFSQGCAISLVWGLIGKYRNEVAGIVPLSGYFPMAGKIEQLRKERGIDDKGTAKWFYAHGDKDILVGPRYFTHGKEELAKYVDFERDVEAHLFERMAHSTAPLELKRMLAFLTRVVPP